MTEQLGIRTLGNLVIALNGKPVSGLPSRAAQALLVYLACQERPIPRERLAELLWADRPPEQALTNLRTILTPLKKKLGNYLLISRGALAFRRETDYRLDVADLESRLTSFDLSGGAPRSLTAEEAEQLREALALYQGDFLEGFYLKDGRGFEEWALVVRERVRRMTSDGLRLLTGHYLAVGSYSEGIDAAERLIQLDPFHEEARRMAMWLQLRAGRRNAALQSYISLRTLLRDELKLEPAAATTALYERIRSQSFPPPLRLPSNATPFIGRAREIRSVERLLLSPAARLITLFGPGGVGKTRLAVEAAGQIYASHQGLFLNGIHFSPLAGLSDPRLLAGSLAAALGLNLQGAKSPEDQLIRYLRDRELLLILDNFEQLLPLQETDSDGRQLLEQLLDRAAGIKILITSRKRLNLREEVVFELKGLMVPAPDSGEAGHFEAVDLFMQAARQKHPAFNPAGEEMPELVQICRLLQGVPLAIELAAQWVRIMSCSQIAAEIVRGLEILSSTQRNIPARHRSMRAVFDQSWTLLEPNLQRIYSGLSTFNGGFDLDSAWAVVRAEATDLLALADSSLLQSVTDQRFDIHELLRQYAAEKLAEEPAQAQQFRSAHARYFLDVLQRLDPASDRDQDSNPWKTADAELSNIRLAWHTALESRDVPGMERGLPGLAQHYLLKGPLDEGQSLIQGTLNQLATGGSRAAPESRLLSGCEAQLARFHIAKGRHEMAVEAAQSAVQSAEAAGASKAAALAILCWGEAIWHQGSYSAARDKIEQALQTARQTGSRYLGAESLRLLGQTFWPLGEYREAETYYNRALEIYRQTHDRHGESMALTYLGILFFEQDAFARARHYMEQAAAMNRDADDKLGEGRVLTNLCVVSCFQGDYGAAVRHNERALQLLDEVGETTGYIANIRNQGMIKVYLGQFAEAEIAQQRALEMFRSTGDRRGEGYALTGLCNLFNQWGDPARSLEYGEKAVALARELGIDYSVVKALTFWGSALAASGLPEEAKLAFQEAHDLGRQSDLPVLALEPQAGLARIALDKGNLVEARKQVEPILAQLDTREPEGASEPLRIYLTCFRVLAASNDPRAGALLETAHQLLQRQAATIEDSELRRSFLTAVPANRELLAVYPQHTAAT